MVSAPKRCRNSMRSRLISSLASRIATMVMGSFERAHQRAADLPVAEVAGDENHALAARERLA